MIFVTVGTQKFQFNRLLQSIDEDIASKRISDIVFAQIGESDYIPQNYAYQRFLSPTDYDEKINQCDILISHGGVATIVKGILAQKKVIVVPRLKKYGEHIDDHQREIADEFEKQNYIVQCINENELPIKIKSVKIHEFAVYHSQRKEIISIIENYLDELN